MEDLLDFGELFTGYDHVAEYEMPPVAPPTNNFFDKAEASPPRSEGAAPPKKKQKISRGPLAPGRGKLQPQVNSELSSEKSY